MTDNPELRAKILDWQRRYNIQDGDPAIALLELVQFMAPSPAAAPVVVTETRAPENVNVKAEVSSESVTEAMRTVLLPATERISFQGQELQQKLEQIDFEKFVRQIEGYHEGIDYCTKKLDVIKKETDALVLKLEKASSQISPITRGAVLMLILGAGVIGWIIGQVF
jgi:hypothetical protein